MKSKIIQAKTNHKWEECVYIVAALSDEFSHLKEFSKFSGW